MSIRDTNGLFGGCDWHGDIEADRCVPSDTPETSEASHSSPLGRSAASEISGFNPGMEGFRHRRQADIRCPFYGFSWPEGSSRLIKVAGNRCGLALDRVESCAREEAGHAVDMEACARAKGLSYFIRSAGPVIAFVLPNCPEGLPYNAWWRITMR